MSASRTKRESKWDPAALLACVGILCFASAASAAPGAGRLALLGQEAARLAAPEHAAAPWSAASWVAAAFCVGIFSAFLGTFFGMRAFAFARWIERDGWREVTVRFRSAPLAIRGDIIPRMTGLLEELEQLAAARKGAAAAPPRARVEPIKFVRREERAESGSPVRTESSNARVEAAREADALAEAARAASTAASTEARIAPRRDAHDSSARYRRASELLREGHDAATIQVMTGLKRAEIDLVRWSPRLGAAS